jgi:hypothetical protein
MREGDLRASQAQFGTSRGNKGIVLRHINTNATRFASNLMIFKLLRKWRKEEDPTGIIAVITQCTKGVMFSWVSYLLNLFFIDSRDVWDNGTEFHYSWFIILIDLV